VRGTFGRIGGDSARGAAAEGAACAGAAATGFEAPPLGDGAERASGETEGEHATSATGSATGSARSQRSFMGASDRRGPDKFREWKNAAAVGNF